MLRTRAPTECLTMRAADQISGHAPPSTHWIPQSRLAPSCEIISFVGSGPLDPVAGRARCTTGAPRYRRSVGKGMCTTERNGLATCGTALPQPPPRLENVSGVQIRTCCAAATRAGGVEPLDSTRRRSARYCTCAGGICDHASRLLEFRARGGAARPARSASDTQPGWVRSRAPNDGRSSCGCIDHLSP